MPTTTNTRRFAGVPGAVDRDGDDGEPTASLVFDTNNGDRWNLHADVSNPLPAHLSFCAAGDGFCNG